MHKNCQTQDDDSFNHRRRLEQSLRWYHRSKAGGSEYSIVTFGLMMMMCVDVVVVVVEEC